jgi:SAM-dependent methyltransferase
MSATTDYVIEQKSAFERMRGRFRARRAAIFHRHFKITPQTTVLDLGGANGAHLNALLRGTSASPSRCTVADVDKAALKDARDRFGFQTVELDREADALPFDPGAFDIVFCSSVLEHVTFSRPDYTVSPWGHGGVWDVMDGSEFRSTALRRQAAFAAEISRVGKGYFVQVPYRHFPVETHTRYPLFQYLPRGLQVSFLRIKRGHGMRGVTPDFYLPSAKEFARYFPEGAITFERILGLPKSMIAVRSA